MKRQVILIIGIILLIAVIWLATMASIEYDVKNEGKENKNYKENIHYCPYYSENVDFNPFLSTIYCKNHIIML